MVGKGRSYPCNVAGMLDSYAGILLRTVRQVEPHHHDSRLPAAPITELHPAFHGCYDWHSAVHSHWSMVRLIRRGVGVDALRSHIECTLTPENIAVETETVSHAPGFEEPYGLAWTLMLAAEAALVEERWASTLAPLVDLARYRIMEWLSAPLDTSGLHCQTAFSLWLLLESARLAEDARAVERVRTVVDRHWGDAVGHSLLGEPGPADFLSPGLTAAVMMAECLDEPAARLKRFIPGLVTELDQTAPVVHDHPSDGRFTHLDGLNLNRAWAASRLARTLPPNDPRRPTLQAFSDRHGEPGLAASMTEEFAGSHWLPTFAVLYLGDRGETDPGGTG